MESREEGFQDGQPRVHLADLFCFSCDLIHSPEVISYFLDLVTPPLHGIPSRTRGLYMIEDMASSDESLLEKHERDSIFSEDDHLRPKPSKRPFRILLAFQILTMCLVPAAYLLGVRQGAKELPPKIPTDVVSRKGLHRKLQVLDDDFWVKDPENKKFTGDPRPELDEAWDGLMKDMNIRVHPEEARQMPGFSSIELNDGTGDMAAVPTVFHNIHCLQAIREMFFPEYYLNTWEIFKPLHKGGIHPHMDHCIENLRQSVMCNADMSLYTYRWIPEQEEPEIIVGMEHVCADWSILADWAEKRSFPLKGHLLTSPYRDEPWDLSSLGLAAHNHTEDPHTLDNDE